ncbi:MAG: regulatory protein RecX [Deltaproteobacteria bacterium]|nr:regulatory protein RecX [Deltaproteobacteria bacterium]
MACQKPTILSTALKLLSRRQHSIEEMGEKLKAKGFPAPEINSAVDYLKGAGYLNDERFASLAAESWIRRKAWGPGRIASYLRLKGIPGEIIKETLRANEAIESESAGRAIEKWLKKKGLRPPLEKKDIEKAFRHLVARGFGAHEATAQIKGLKGVDPRE